MLKRSLIVAALFFAPAGFSACATGPAVVRSAELPVRKIVMYRNGVSYIERAGSFDGEVLTFSVRAGEVGDFLTSLTAVEQGDGTVRSVAFDAPKQNPSEDEEPSDRVDVKLRFSEDTSHELAVSYVVGAPIWRPAYRVVITRKDQVLLQAWAVVQNTSGEDWRDVKLSLTTGAPIAFRSDLGTPFTPQRPLVTDTGEVITAVPKAHTALARRPRDGGDTQEEDAAGATDVKPSGAPMGQMMEMDIAAPVRMKRSGRSRMAMAPPLPASAAVGSSVKALASVEVQAEGVTRYDLDGRLTIPDGSSTMVAVLSQTIPGKRAYLYSPEAGVPASHQHPFSVVRFKNVTGAHLERGPISVYGGGNFLGQGVLASLAPDATTFIPFATDRGLVVRPNVNSEESEGRLVRVNRGRITVERFLQRKTSYRIQNGTGEAAKVYVRHGRYRDAEVVNPPEGTEFTAQHLLIPVNVAAKSDTAYEVLEQTPVKRTVEFISDVGANAVALYLQGPAVDVAQGPVLKEALVLRERLLAARRRSGDLRGQRHLLRESSAETRENLKSIKSVSRAKDLRKRLTVRLSELDGQVAGLTGQLVEVDAELSELKVRLAESLRNVSLMSSSSK